MLSAQRAQVSLGGCKVTLRRLELQCQTALGLRFQNIGNLEVMHDRYLPTVLMRALPIIWERTRRMRGELICHV